MTISGGVASAVFIRQLYRFLGTDKKARRSLKKNKHLKELPLFKKINIQHINRSVISSPEIDERETNTLNVLTLDPIWKHTKEHQDVGGMMIAACRPLRQ